MKNTTKILISLFAIVYSVSINAQGPGWTPVSKVTRLVVVGNGGVNVKLSPSVSGCTSHAGHGGAYAPLHTDHPGFSTIHATLLAARVSGEDVQIYFGDSTCKIIEIVIGGAFNTTNP